MKKPATMTMTVILGITLTLALVACSLWEFTPEAIMPPLNQLPPVATTKPTPEPTPEPEKTITEITEFMVIDSDFVVDIEGNLWVSSFSDGEASFSNILEDVERVEFSDVLQRPYFIKTDNSMWSFQWNEEGRQDLVHNLDDVASLYIIDGWDSGQTATYTSALVIKTDGSLWGWGENGKGQLGDGTTENREVPVKIMDNVASLHFHSRLYGDHSAIINSTFALKTDGNLWAWGDNEDGELGDGTIETRFSPVHIIEGVGEITVNRHSSGVYVIKTDGSLWMWGNHYTSDYGNTPVYIMDNVESFISTFGSTLFYALTPDGALYGWGGSPAVGEFIGDGSLSRIDIERNPDLRPVHVMDDVIDVTVYYTVQALKADGSLWTWGLHNISPVCIEEDIDENYWWSFIKTDRSFWVWSGDNLEQGMRTPVHIMDDVDKVDLGLGGAIIKTDGSLWMLITGLDDDNEVTRTTVYIMDDVVSAYSGGYYDAEWNMIFFSLAKKADGSLWTWGDDLEIPVLIMEDVDSVYGWDETIIKTDGTVWVWGDRAGFMVGRENIHDVNYLNPVQVMIRIEQ